MAVILDLASRLVVGWAMGERDDAHLGSRARAMAVLRRDPPAEMIVPASQGRPSTCQGSQRTVAERGSVVSRRRVGDGSNNAAMERVFRTLKGASVDRTRFPTRQEARHTIVAYLEWFSNRVRRHSPLTSVRPLECEDRTRSFPCVLSPKKSENPSFLDEMSSPKVTLLGNFCGCSCFHLRGEEPKEHV